MDHGLVALSILAGVSFGLNGLALRGGTARGLTVFQITAVMCAAGTALFGARLVAGPPASASAYAYGVVAGLSNYATLLVISGALRRGPLTALWCALMLNFVPVIVYAGLVLHEPQRWNAWLAAAIGVAAVVVASGLGRDAGAGGAAAGGRGARWRYLGVLAAAFSLNSVANVVLKQTERDGLMATSGDAFIFALYAAYLAALLADLALRRQPLPSLRALAAWGGLAAFGSIVGLSLMARCVALPAAIVFTGITCSSILVAATAGTLAFGERRSPGWYATVSLACAAVVVAACG